jgi:hypothetical protein
MGPSWLNHDAPRFPQMKIDSILTFLKQEQLRIAQAISVLKELASGKNSSAGTK